MSESQILLLALCGCLTVGFLIRGSPIDLIALTGLLMAGALGLIPESRLFSGFSSAAVVTMVAVFFLGAAVKSSGANEACGNLIFKISGGRTKLALFFLVLISGFVSAFMNNVAAVALMLPVTIALAQKLLIPASQLLLPMSFGAILGGMTTIVGTPPNLIAADIFAERGFKALDSVDFLIPGGCALLAGCFTILFFAPKLLPKHNDKPPVSNPELEKLYEILSHTYVVKIPHGSPLVGRSLAEIGASAALDAQVVAVMRETETILAPMPDFKFRSDDLAVLGGEQADLNLFKNFASFEALESISTLNPSFSSFRSAIVSLKSTGTDWSQDKLLILSADNNLIPLFIKRGISTLSWNPTELGAEDQIIILGSKDGLDRLLQSQSMSVEFHDKEVDAIAQRSVFGLAIADSFSEQVLKACELLKTRLGITLLAVQREEKLIDVERRALEPQQGDVLLFLGEAKKIKQLKDLLSVESVDHLPKLFLNSADVGVSEVVLSPRSKLVGKSLSELDFRERYGFRVLSVWREGKPIFQRLGHEPLRFGDALLLLGPKQHLELLRDDPDFLVLTTNQVSRINTWKVLLVVIAAMLLVLLPVFKICSVPVAAVIVACFVCLTGVVRVSDAYRHVEWRVVIFTAALLPFSYAVESTGFSDLTANFIKGVVGSNSSPIIVMVFFGLVSSLISQLLDGPVAVLLLSPIAISMAQALKFNPEAIVLMVALSASVTFLFPISHKAHLLVLGPGAYKNRDFLKIGLLVSIVTFLTILFSLIAVYSLG